MNTEQKKAYEIWKEHCQHIQSLTEIINVSESDEERTKRIVKLQRNYQQFCEYYFPHWVQLRDKTTGEVIKTIKNQHISMS